MNKDVKAYQRALARRGYKMRYSRKHIEVRHPVFDTLLITVPKTPSDHHWRENCDSQLRGALQKLGLREPQRRTVKEAHMATPLPRGLQQRLHEILRHMQEELGTKTTKSKKYGYGTMVHAAQAWRDLAAEKGHGLHRADGLKNDALAQRLRAALAGHRISSQILGDVVWFIETFEDTVTAPAPKEAETMAEPAPVIEIQTQTRGSSSTEFTPRIVHGGGAYGPDHEPIRALMRMLAIVQPAFRGEALEQANVVYNALTGAQETAAAVE